MQQLEEVVPSLEEKSGYCSTPIRSHVCCKKPTHATERNVPASNAVDILNPIEAGAPVFGEIGGPIREG